MKIAAISVGLGSLGLGLALVCSAQAAELRAPVAKQLYTCSVVGVSRVAATTRNPAQCCEGQLSCSQFLATTTVVRTRQDLRT